ncbi:hypothetical protein SAMN05660293_04559 [Dyadobacter psychrophilus]|uniref:Uncharacterized protein n=1 Tax=Dyadobacter psychrophilus TaxID=651661 RepID=A0A1T5GY46_9BACT|nr:hypothetical protein SAMN05660293_04559 [Dyadobacter psychrophilus]
MRFNGDYAGGLNYRINITDKLGKYTSISFANSLSCTQAGTNPLNGQG